MSANSGKKVIHLDFSKRLQEVEHLPDRMWVAESESTAGIYYVIMYYTSTDASICTCPGWQFRNDCKHTQEVMRLTKR